MAVNVHSGGDLAKALMYIAAFVGFRCRRSDVGSGLDLPRGHQRHGQQPRAVRHRRHRLDRPYDPVIPLLWTCREITLPALSRGKGGPPSGRIVLEPTLSTCSGVGFRFSGVPSGSGAWKAVLLESCSSCGRGMRPRARPVFAPGTRPEPLSEKPFSPMSRAPLLRPAAHGHRNARAGEKLGKRHP